MSKPFTPISRQRIAKFAKHRDTAVLVHINKFDDADEPLTFVDIRQFQQDEDGEYLPTNKGLSIHKDHVLKLRKVLDKAIKKLGLIDKPKAKKRKKK